MTALGGGIPDRPPISFDGCADFAPMQEVYRYFGARDKNGLYTAAGIDGFSVWEWNAVMGRYPGVTKRSPQGADLDFWGNHYPESAGLSECHTIQELESHRWPRVEDFDFSHIYSLAKEIRGKDMPVSAGHMGLGYQMHNMLRGNELALLDVTDEKYTECLLDHLLHFTLEYLEALLKAGRGLIDVVRADDDIGTMDRLIISPAMWRKYYKPAWKKGIDLAHRYGAKIWFHSCGCIMPLLEDLIEIGIDCWNPFPEYVWGNDHKQLKQLRKGRLALDGGVSHLVLVQGTEREVVEETRRVLDLFAPDGGLLIGPSQVFTQDMPAANIIAFLETALAYQG